MVDHLKNAKRAESFEHNPVKRLADNNPPGLRPRVDAMCAHCMGCTVDHMEPGWRKLVRECTTTACPLWEVRKYKPEGK